MAEDSLKEIMYRFAAVEVEVLRKCGLMLSAVEVRFGLHWMVFGGGVAYSTEEFTPESIRSGRETYSDDFDSLSVFYQDGVAIVSSGDGYHAFFDQDLECKDRDLAEMYRETWG